MNKSFLSFSLKNKKISSFYKTTVRVRFNHFYIYRTRDPEVIYVPDNFDKIKTQSPILETRLLGFILKKEMAGKNRYKMEKVFMILICLKIYSFQGKNEKNCFGYKETFKLNNFEYDKAEEDLKDSIVKLNEENSE